MRANAVFAPSELQAAVLFAMAIEIVLALMLALAGTVAGIKAAEPVAEKLMPISVTPVLDDLPLLKKGGKPVKAKLPDMWQKPKVVKRYKDLSAPSAEASLSPDDIPSSEVAKEDETPPPPDAAVAKEVDELVPESQEAVEEVAMEEEGAADGIEEGTEADPLKARAVSLYGQKIAAWFNARFKQPTEIPCEELQQLVARVSANIGSERTVTGYTLSAGSGNAIFDARVKSTMEGSIGQQIPPPPQNYPEILEEAIFTVFHGRCQ